MSSLSSTSLKANYNFKGTTSWCFTSCEEILEAISSFNSPQSSILDCKQEVKKNALLFSDGSLRVISAGSSPIPKQWSTLSLQNRLFHFWHSVVAEDYISDNHRSDRELVAGSSSVNKKYLQPLSLAELSLGHAAKVFSVNSKDAKKFHLTKVSLRDRFVEEQNKKIKVLQTITQTKGLLLASLMCVSLANAGQVKLFN